jgi:bifunctional enzyme CysN/CysC/sulfate adenylyltransferase subunit 1
LFTLVLNHPIALTTFNDNETLGKFVIVDKYNATGGGIVAEILKDNEYMNSSFEEELFAILRKYFPHRF